MKEVPVEEGEPLEQESPRGVDPPVVRAPVLQPEVHELLQQLQPAPTTEERMEGFTTYTQRTNVPTPQMESI